MISTDEELVILEQLDFHPPCRVYTSIASLGSGELKLTPSEPIECGNPATIHPQCQGCGAIGMICSEHWSQMKQTRAVCFGCNRHGDRDYVFAVIS